MEAIARDTLVGTAPIHGVAAFALGATTFAPLVQTPSHPRCEAVVIVPAKNEAAGIRAMLHALVKQRDLAGRPLDHARYEVILLANNCTDRTAYHARDFARVWPAFALRVVEITLPPGQANVGTARRLLMDEAYRRLRALGKPGGAILSTDADSRVSPTWVAANLDALARGADAVGGRILTDPAEYDALRPALRLRYLRDNVYQLLMAELEACVSPIAWDPWPRHHQHFGASLALTARTYERVGGLPRVPNLEDVALVRALWKVDARIRHTPAVRITTSARRAGRAEKGLSELLAQWECKGTALPVQRVDSLPALEARFVRQGKLYALWHGARRGYAPDGETLAAVAHAFAVEVGWLSGALREGMGWGMLHANTLARRNAEGRWIAPKQVPVTEAIPALRARLAPWREAEMRRLALAAPLPQVEAVRRRPLSDLMIETGAFPRLEQPMNGVAVQDTLRDLRRPVDEEQLPPRFEVRDHRRPRPR